MNYEISGCKVCPMYEKFWAGIPIKLISKCKHPNSNIENIKTELGEGGYVTPITPISCPLETEPITISKTKDGVQ